MELSLFNLLIPALVGVCVGVLSAMFGIGGGVVMVPVIRIFFDRAASVASASSLFAILPTSLMGMYARRNDKSLYYGYGLILGLGGALCSPVGAYMATHLPGWLAMTTTACLICFTSYKQFKKLGYFGSKSSGKIAEVHRDPLPIKDQLSLEHAKYCLPIGAVAGVLSGFIGVGGGFIIVPLLCRFLGLSIKEGTGTSLVAVCLLAIPGVLSHAYYGNIDYLLGLMFVIGSLPGAQLGARLVRTYSNKRLTLLFAFVLLGAGLLLLVKEFI